MASGFIIDPNTGMITRKKQQSPQLFAFNAQQALAGDSTLPGDGPGGTQGGGNTPIAPIPYQDRFRDLIENDPTYRDALRRYGADDEANVAQLRQLRRNAIAMFGENPLWDDATKKLFGDTFAQDIDEETLALAARNTEAGLSTTARLSQANTDARRDTLNSLAARGLHRGGDLGFYLGRLQRDFGAAQFDARSKLGSALQDWNKGYVDAKREIEEAKARALEEARMRALLDWLIGQGGGSAGGGDGSGAGDSGGGTTGGGGATGGASTSQTGVPQVPYRYVPAANAYVPPNPQETAERVGTGGHGVTRIARGRGRLF